VDAYQCDGLYPWDAAAGTLIVQEAGGHVVDSSGGVFDLMHPNYLATSTEALSCQFMKEERMADECLVKKQDTRFMVEDIHYKDDEKIQ